MSYFFKVKLLENYVFQSVQYAFDLVSYFAVTRLATLVGFLEHKCLI